MGQPGSPTMRELCCLEGAGGVWWGGFPAPDVCCCTVEKVELSREIVGGLRGLRDKALPSAEQKIDELIHEGRTIASGGHLVIWWGESPNFWLICLSDGRDLIEV